MQRMKRIAYLLAILTALFTATTVYAADMTVAAENKTVWLGTEEATVSISISDNVGIAGMRLAIDYDPALTLVKIECGSALADFTFTPGGDLSANPFRFFMDNEGADDSNGVVATLTFAVPKQVGTYYVRPELIDLYDNSLQDVDAVTVSGGVNVVGIKPTTASGNRLNWTVFVDPEIKATRLLVAAYSEAGKMLFAKIATQKDGVWAGSETLSEPAATVKAFALNGEYSPICNAMVAAVSPQQ